eukprot:scaffold47243_cov16-Tisochrysis_lutea.AAC.1
MGVESAEGKSVGGSGGPQQPVRTVPRWGTADHSIFNILAFRNRPYRDQGFLMNSAVGARPAGLPAQTDLELPSTPVPPPGGSAGKEPGLVAAVRFKRRPATLWEIDTRKSQQVPWPHLSYYPAPFCAFAWVINLVSPDSFTPRSMHDHHHHQQQQQQQQWQQPPLFCIASSNSSNSSSMSCHIAVASDSPT